MRAALLLALLAASAAEARDRRCLKSRADARTGDCVGYALFEAFPASGAGTTSACSTTAPTGARGEALTFTRTGSATCTKTASGGLATTGIADGDLVTVAGGVARVEYDSAGTLGLLMESSRTNVFLQSNDISNAVNTNVGAPTLTGSQTDPFGTTTAVRVQDASGAALEGRTQTVTVTAATAYVMSCFLKAGTSALAQLSLDGTTCNVSGLSTSTWTRASCADASSSGAAIAAQVLVGNVAGDTGTVTVFGCQVEAGTYMTSYQPSGAAAAVRNAELASFPLAMTAPATGCMRASVVTPGPLTGAGGLLSCEAATSHKQLLYGGKILYVGGSAVATSFASWLAGAHTVSGTWTASASAIVIDGASTAGSAGVGATVDTLRIGNFGNSTAQIEPGIYSRIQVDPAASRCSP